MPCDSEMLENVLIKDKKHVKKYKERKCNDVRACDRVCDDIPKPEILKPCNIECCIPDCNPECCTAAFQRLDKLRVYWLLSQYAVIPPSVYNRAGNLIPVPTYTDTTPQQTGSSPNTWGTNERQAFAFVNTVRYLTYEECGKLDQVIGWSIDVQAGDLYFYQNLPELGLNTGDSRANYLSQNASSFTPQDKQKLCAMEPFWKLSLKAVERIRENPKTEGNICEVKDKCGARFLIAINRADGQITQISGTPTYAGNSVCDYNSQYSIVVVKLC
jgi:hypothetical protein